MKIAICFNSYKNLDDNKYIFIKNILDDIYSDCDVDYFVHGWSFMNNSEKIEKDLKAKKCLFEDKHIYDSRHRIINELSLYNENEPVLEEHIPLIYSNMRVGQLKIDYEIEKNIIYDICININVDIDININFFEKKIIQGAIKSEYFTNTGHFPFEKINYNLYMSDSETFDLLSLFYNLLPIIRIGSYSDNIDISSVFAYYIRMFKIKIKK